MVMWLYPNGDVSVGNVLGVAGQQVVSCINTLEHVNRNTFAGANVVACRKENGIKCL